MTEVWWDRLKELGNLPKGHFLQITVHPSQYNFAIGYYGRNRKRLEKTYSMVVFITDRNLKVNEFHADHR